MRLFFLIFFVLNSYLNSAVLNYKFFKKNADRGNITVYEIDGKTYLDLKEFSKILNAGLEIYSASGRIIFSINSKRLMITKNNVSYHGVETISFSKTFIIRGTRYFVLSEIFTNPTFTKIFEIRFDIDEKNRFIYAYDNINVTSVKYFYYIEKSRIVIYLSKKLDYDVNIVGRSLVITVKNGSYITSKDYINADDGVVKSLSIRQERDSLKVVVDLGPRYSDFEHRFEENPDKIIIDINQLKDDIPSRIPDSSQQSTVSVTLPDRISIKKNDKYVVVIDPGHGGKDPGGRVIFGKPEKQINLEISKYLYELLSKDNRFEVKLTRNDDVFVPLYERSKFANNEKCDIFISIHANAHPKRKSEEGFEVYFLSEKATDPWAREVADYENASIEYEEGVFDYSGTALVLHSIARNEYINEGSFLAAYITKHMEKLTPFKNRGVKQAAFYVLRGTYCPSVLVEVGFMTNKKDKKNLDDKNVQKKVAQSIYNGLVEYIKNKR